MPIEITPAPTTVVADTHSVTTVPTTKEALTPLLTDAEQTAATLLQVWRSHGAEGVAAFLPVIQKDIKDVEIAVPTIKKGYKTTEFWATAAGLIVVAIIGVEGKDTAFQSVEALIALIGSYTVSRGVAKKGN